MADFLYTLDSSEKIECPSCHHDRCFVRYKNTSTGRYLEDGYGRCDRENNCGYHKKPENNQKLKINPNEEEVVTSILECDYIPEFFYKEIHENTKKIPNVLLRGLVDLFGKDAVKRIYSQYKLGTWKDGATVFPYYTYDLHTAKIIWYDETLHRIKEGKKSRIQWLHNCNYTDDSGQDYTIQWDGRRTVPFFGHHLLCGKDTKRLETYICIVESEKTAIIMAMLFPEYIWLATGGLQNLHKYKFMLFQKTKVLIFPDLGIMKSQHISVRDLWNIKINEATTVVDMRYAFVNYVPYNMSTITKEKWVDNGCDVLDFVFEYPPSALDSKYETYVDYLKVMIEEAKKLC